MLAKKDLTIIQKRLSRYDEVREEVLSLSRIATRQAGATILDVHRGEIGSAANSILKIEQTLAKIQALSDDFPEFRTSQGVVVAFQEYVEAVTVRTFAQKGTIPSLNELKSDHRSYLLGLLDAVGEFRRMALNALRQGEVKRAERLLDAMEGIYDDLQTLDHTSIVPTFRVKVDAARRIIESTRGDVVSEVRRFSLEKALSRVEKKLGPDPKP